MGIQGVLRVNSSTCEELKQKGIDQDMGIPLPGEAY
jgi:hypothetical protein